MRIIGDYDIDGVTATYILLKGFKRLGANVDTYIPDRIADGYGIHNHLIEKAKEDGVDTIVTCDNGISAADQIAFAKKMGMTVVVTDHHEVPFEDTEEGRKYKLPLADAIINPKQSDCTYPNKNICGAVVAMKLVFALYEKYGIPESEKRRLSGTCGYRYSWRYYGPSGRKPYSCKRGTFTSASYKKIRD